MPTISPLTTMFTAKPHPQGHIHLPFAHFQGCEDILSHLPVEQVVGVDAGGSWYPALGFALSCVTVGVVALFSWVSVSCHTDTRVHTISLAFSSP